MTATMIKHPATMTEQPATMTEQPTNMTKQPANTFGSDTIFSPRHLRPTVGNFLPDVSLAHHMRQVYQSHIADVWTRSWPKFSQCSITISPIDVLPAVKTTTFPLPCMNINQSTIEGNLAITEAITNDTLRLPESWFQDQNIIVASDQLTVARL